MSPISEFEKAWIERRTRQLVREDLYYAAARMIAMREMEKIRERLPHRRP
ncbi:MAG: hypothetical protein AAGL69_08045 [Pseudomonadota bacterium]